jgi:hypothetical protein
MGRRLRGRAAWARIGILILVGATVTVCKNPLFDMISRSLMVVSEGTTSIVAGGSYSFGEVAEGTSKDVSFTVQNAGTAVLTISGAVPVELSGSPMFSLMESPSASVGPGAATKITIRFAPTEAGPQSATVTFTSNDPDQAVYSFTVTATATASPPIGAVFVKRLLVMDEYQPVTFQGESSRVCTADVPTNGRYRISWSDAGSGDGLASVDVTVSLSNPDGSPNAGIQGVDSAYTTPIDLDLTSGTYTLTLSTKDQNPAAGECSVLFQKLGDVTTFDLSVYQRILVADEYTQVSFAAETERWLVCTVTAAGSYSLRWSDSQEGNGTATADVDVSLYASDRTTVVGGVSGIDSGYLAPRTVSLSTGNYFVRLASHSGSPVSGTATVKLASSAPSGELSLSFFPRLLLVDEFTLVSFKSEVATRFVLTVPGGTYTLQWCDSGQGDGTATVDVLVSIFTEAGDPVASYVDMDSGYSGVLVSLPAGTYRVRLAAKDGLPATGTCKMKMY